MVKKTFELPRCPNCGANLFRVLETNYIVYKFDSTSGRYKEADGEAEMKCPECQADLYDIFPDGVCNYSAKSKASKIAL